MAELPEGVKPMQVAGVSLLAGVGFTMSIFIANLAYAGSPLYIDSAKIGIILGSLLAGLGGYLILRFSGTPLPEDLEKHREKEEVTENQYYDNPMIRQA